jgi:mannose-6-phosphate isomerase-like protein (cupin superfamily)
MEPTNLLQKLSLFSETWSPKIIGELNGQHVKLSKLDGEFIWHTHDNEDELFLVIEGELELKFRDGSVTLRDGDLHIVPRGVEHLPIAHKPTSVLLFEPASTINTGASEDDRRMAPDSLDRL